MVSSFAVRSDGAAMQTDLATIRKQVLETARRSSVAERVEDVVLEPGRDDEGADFLRVIVQVKPGDESDDAELEALPEAIESTVGSLDERYPSVRFSEAA
jgi:hypothetical protein